MQSCICLCRVSIDVPHSEGHRKAVVSNLMFPYKKLGGFFFLFLLDKFIYLNENFFKNFQLSTSTKILRNLDKVVHFIFIFSVLGFFLKYKEALVPVMTSLFTQQGQSKCQWRKESVAHISSGCTE